MKVNIESNEFRQNLKRMIGKRVSSPEDLEDITQDVLLKVVKYARTEEPASFFSWLKMTVNSSIGDFYRKGGTKIEQSSVHYSEGLTHDGEIKRDLTCCIDPFLKKMRSEDAALVREIDLNGRSQLEMASSLNLNYSTLKSRLQKSRKKLLQGIFACCPLGAEDFSNKFNCN